LREIRWSLDEDGIPRGRVRSCGELERICSVCGILGMELWSKRGEWRGGRRECSGDGEALVCLLGR
jgi:hypothetical protein